MISTKNGGVERHAKRGLDRETEERDKLIKRSVSEDWDGAGAFWTT
jgi:hypothetical protein